MLDAKYARQLTNETRLPNGVVESVLKEIRTRAKLGFDYLTITDSKVADGMFLDTGMYFPRLITLLRAELEALGFEVRSNKITW